MNKHQFMLSKKYNFLFIPILIVIIIFVMTLLENDQIKTIQVQYDKMYSVFLSFFSIYFGVLITLNITFPNKNILERKMKTFNNLYSLLIMDIFLLVLFFISTLMNLYIDSYIIDVFSLSVIINVVLCLGRLIFILYRFNQIIDVNEKQYYSKAIENINGKVNYISQVLEKVEKKLVEGENGNE